MTKDLDNKLSAQAHGRIGELYVEVELLKRGWLVANINNSIKNAVAFDIIAVKGKKRVGIRVKTFQEQHHGAQYGAKSNLSPFVDLQKDNDFAAIVRLNEDESYDVFLVPTKIVDREIKKDFNAYVERGVEKGKWDKEDKIKNHKHRSITFKSTKNKKGLSEKWKKYKNNWDGLEK